MTMSERNWSELSPDLLRCVLERLNLIDFNRARSVCSSWHSASRGCVPKRNQIPWLILFPRENSDNKSSCVMFIPNERDKVYRTRDLGVEFVRSCCLASYGSWLLMMDTKWNLYILNPLTGERIDLPLTESVVPESSRPMLKSSVACLWIDEKAKDYLVVWTFGRWLPVFTKKGNDRWRRISCNVTINESTGHMVYNRMAQKLYVYCDNDAVHIWCFRGDDPQRIYSQYCRLFGFNYREFLPVLKREDEKLFLQELVDGWVNIATSVSGQLLKISSLVLRSWLFSISETQDLRGKIDSLGDEALILDMGIYVVAKDIPGIKRNSIYFSGTGYGRENPDHIFVFDLTTHKIEHLPQCVYSSINFSDARWFFPGLND